MKAIGYSDSLPIDDPRALFDFEAPTPAPGPYDLLVRVAAVSVNPVDTKVRVRRTGTDDAPVILGWDAAGVVEAVGTAVSLFRPGDAVYYAGDLQRPGTNAQYHLVDERIAAAKPASLDFPAAAALPLTALTAWEMLFDRLKLSLPAADGSRQRGRLLIVGGAGGVGSIAIQLARRLTDMTVIATASRPQSIAWVRELGAHHAVDHSKPLDEEIAALGLDGGLDGGVDAIFSTNATDHHWPALVRALAPQGRVGLIDDPDAFDVRLLKGKSASLHWELMFTRSMFQTADMIRQHEILTEVARLVDTGSLRTTLTEVLGPIDAATLRRAHALIESGRSIGKLVLAGF